MCFASKTVNSAVSSVLFSCSLLINYKIITLVHYLRPITNIVFSSFVIRDKHGIRKLSHNANLTYTFTKYTFYYFSVSKSNLTAKLTLLLFSGFLTLPTAYVTGNPVECVLHPSLWNKSHVWDPLGVGQVYTDQYEEDNVGHPVTTVSTNLVLF
jgi:hypothetical protein